MKSYLKLTNFEIDRFFKIYLVLIAITVTVQIIGTIIVANDYMNRASRIMNEESLQTSAFIHNYGYFSLLNLMDSLWFFGPIAFCVAGLIFYTFFIWYRDWYGKNTFIYRLLMLPTSRLNVFFAKATAIFLMVLGLIALQLVLLYIEELIVELIVPLEFIQFTSIPQIMNAINSAYVVLFPKTFIEFSLIYGTGLIAVFTLFTAILLERSYRWKGVLMGAGYCIVASGIFLSPVLISELSGNYYLYIGEIIILEVALGCIIIASSIWLSRFLLNKKITV
ncbi:MULTISPECIES: hypothetical protein [Virgibacillus]|uniref:ABC transporter permease n=1 Tax=Virgibacillus kapii TaxID=1638645 RepID=A0ABQ2DPX9_9BACI|nr:MULTISPECIES: hypothetical protein [Virgibacillus]EQB38938.1 hypothetical protein M948_00915 [Virgibacillus sp. CM-4]GGJ67289.1 hypothetical protein GCM10007111_31520 [Virgibacillus kapii]